MFEFQEFLSVPVKKNSVIDKSAEMEKKTLFIFGDRS